MGKFRSIVISRLMGSGGSYIGYLAARELGFRYLDRQILREASDRLGVDTALIEHAEERSAGIIESLLRSFSSGAPESAFIPPMGRAVYERDLFQLESRIMNRVVDEVGAVIVGRGAFYALKDRPDVFRVFIHAPLEFRIRRVMEVRKNAEYETVKSQVIESDRRRTKFVKDIIGVNWMDARNFHLCVDSSAVDFRSILGMIKNFFS